MPRRVSKSRLAGAALGGLTSMVLVVAAVFTLAHHLAAS